MDRVMFLILLLVFSTMAIVGSQMAVDDYEQDETFDIYNFTSKSLNWTKLTNLSSTEFTKDNMEFHHIMNIVYSYVNFIGEVTLEISKWSIEYGYEHPGLYEKFGSGWMVKLTKIVAYFIILSFVVPIIIPLIALIYLFVQGIEWLYINIKLKIKKSKSRRGLN